MKSPRITHRRSVARTRARPSRPRLEVMEDRTLLATIVVTGAGDAIAVDGVVTLREAIAAANTNAASGDAAAGSPGLDTIAFNIPGGGVQTIATLTDLPATTEPVVIDGYTQPEARPNANGPGLGGDAVLRIQIVPSVGRVGTNGLLIDGGGSTVRGLVIDSGFNNGINVRALGGNTIVGNYIGTTPDGLSKATNPGSSNAILVQSSNNRIGGPAPADRNVIVSYQGIHVPSGPAVEASNNVIQGNFIGTDAAGARGFRGDFLGVFIESGSGDRIGGSEPGEGNLISGVSQAVSIYLGGPHEDPDIRNSNGGHVIQGNLIGPDVTGNALLPFINSSNNPSVGFEAIGIFIINLGHYDPTVDPLPITIGGPAPGAGNVIGGSVSGSAMRLDYPQEFDAPTTIQGNYIGTDRTGLLNFRNVYGGIELGRTMKNVGIVGNTIAFNSASFNSAVIIPPGETGNFVVGNSIHDNGAGNPGIIRTSDLGPAAPVLTSATVAGAATIVQGTVAGAAGSVVRVDLYANATPTPPNTVQGQTPVLTVMVTIGANGIGTFTANFAAVASQPLITATATSPGNTTSPFSAPAGSVFVDTSADLSVAVVGAPGTVAPGGDVRFTLTVVNAGPDASQGLTLTGAVPLGATFVSFAAPAGWTTSTPAVGAAGPVVANAPNLAVGSIATFTLIVRVDAGAAGGSTITNTASIAASTPDVDPADDDASAAVTVAAGETPPPGENPPPAPASADLVVSLAADPGVVIVGDTIVYTLRVLNAGPSPATGVVLSDALPVGVDFVSASLGSYDPTSRILTVGLGGLAPGVGATITLTARAGVAGTIVNVARVRADQADPDSGDNTAARTDAVGPLAAAGGPRVTSVLRNGIHAMPTSLVVSFDRDLDPTRAQDVGNYRLAAAGRDVPVGSATYDASSRAVTIRPVGRINIHHPFLLVVGGGLADAAGNALDGSGDGRPGTDYRANVVWYGPGTRVSPERPAASRTPLRASYRAALPSRPTPRFASPIRPQVHAMARASR
ncbi:hypothetical protein [Paludisphaera mucosa]|uniref:DUF11 domain-containing protein n=1 Tax=Paludisphaera mucosa TaxID=3030827 RepID=A0ABT6FI64_9BACT|nr:hypothetical protein [Paludisphaera mucosa]MDG3007239.1 hypothetical protein [Paludisphaera mucosa]